MENYWFEDQECDRHMTITNEKALSKWQWEEIVDEDDLADDLDFPWEEVWGDID